MSSPRVQKILEAMPNQIRRLGGHTFDFREVLRFQGRVAAGAAQAGRDTGLIDIDSPAWTTANRRSILIAEVASDQNENQGFKTQSHAKDHFLDGSVRWHMYLETPASVSDAHSQFNRELIHHFLGQLASPLKLWFTANGTEPKIDGVNGATASATFTMADDWLIPYGISFPGGV